MYKISSLMKTVSSNLSGLFVFFINLIIIFYIIFKKNNEHKSILSKKTCIDNLILINFVPQNNIMIQYLYKTSLHASQCATEASFNLHAYGSAAPQPQKLFHASKGIPRRNTNPKDTNKVLARIRRRHRRPICAVTARHMLSNSTPI